MPVKYEKLSLGSAKRIISVSDIHGNLTFFKKLLEKVNFGENDELILIGDLYTKGRECHETLKYIMALSEKPNVHPIRGNCDFLEDYLSESEKNFLENLPHIIESEEYIFVHGGLPSMDFNSFEPYDCMKYDDFMEKTTLNFDKYVITGHWPLNNYCHGIASQNPIINEEKRIIAIDGGCVVLSGGQLNAFIIENGEFSFEAVDDLPKVTVKTPQSASFDPLTVCYQDRFLELISEGEEFSLCCHLATGKLIMLPNNSLWHDTDGRLCASGSRATTYFLPVLAGDEISIVNEYSDRVHAKFRGVSGYVLKENL